jgi:circadian clock protein KaiC
VRELVLSSSGLTIAAPYTADGTVLMGTLRWQKERDEDEERNRLAAEFERKDAAANDEIGQLNDRVQTLQRIIAEKQLAKSSIMEAEQARQRGDGLRRSGMIRLRQSAELGSAEAPDSSYNKEKGG